jgi:hypothetical protein
MRSATITAVPGDWCQPAGVVDRQVVVQLKKMVAKGVFHGLHRRVSPFGGFSFRRPGQRAPASIVSLCGNPTQNVLQ